jgi:DUF4097 and DUF4098 domain-containing protein YvlB
MLMLRAVCLTAAFVALLGALGGSEGPPYAIGVAYAQTREVECRDRGSRDRDVYCETREETFAGGGLLDVNASPNGGIRVRGWDRSDIRVVATVMAQADSPARARELAQDVRIETGERIRATGPSSGRREHWHVSFEVDVPRDARVALSTTNGGITIENFRGQASFRATNGGVTLTSVNGDIRGETTNGGVTVRLDGDRWEGAGLDVETRNGGIRMFVPDRYSAELETATVNGRVNIDFPVTVQGSIGRDIRATLGSGGPRVRAVTRNGGVTIQRR